MRAVVLLAMLMFVLRGCASEEAERRERQRAILQAPMGDTAKIDPFVTGSSYRFVIKPSAITPGLEKSSAVLKVSIRDFVSNDNRDRRGQYHRG